MDKKMIQRIENELNDCAKRTIAEFDKYGINVKVKVEECNEINACVGKICGEEKSYLIKIYTGVIDTLKYALENKYMLNVEEDCFLHYQLGEEGKLYRYFDDSTLKNSFMNIMAKFIGFNILFHECGHILLGHCDKGKISLSEQNSRKDIKNSYGHQAREFMADWYGIKKSMTLTLYSFCKVYNYSINSFEDVLLLKKVIVVAYLALYCQFDLFEANMKNNILSKGELNEFNQFELKKRSHPHPYVRLIYSLDAMKEAVMDVIEVTNNVDSVTSENVVSMILCSALKDINMFFEKMEIGINQSDLTNPNIIECYINIRKRAAYPKHSSKPYIKYEMSKMPVAYLESLRDSKKLLISIDKT